MSRRRSKVLLILQHTLAALSHNAPALRGPGLYWQIQLNDDESGLAIGPTDVVTAVEKDRLIKVPSFSLIRVYACALCMQSSKYPLGTQLEGLSPAGTAWKDVCVKLQPLVLMACNSGSDPVAFQYRNDAIAPICESSGIAPAFSACELECKTLPYVMVLQS